MIQKDDITIGQILLVVGGYVVYVLGACVLFYFGD